MTTQEAIVQAFENGRRQVDAEGYARGKAEAFVEAGDLISRKALLEKAVEVPGHISRMVSSYDVATAPAVAAKPVKRGRWIREGNRNTCPECGFFYHSAHADYDYCPKCGMKMDGEDHGKRKAVD